MGESAIIIVVPEVEPLVAETRLRYDPGAGLGVPAHITLLYPWLPPPLPEAALRQLEALAAQSTRYAIAFRSLGRFERTLYLEPDDGGQTAALISRLAAAFPAYPPYGGVFSDVVPHLTVAESPDIDLLSEQVAPPLLRGLPVTTEVIALTVIESEDGGCWAVRAVLPLTA